MRTKKVVFTFAPMILSPEETAGGEKDMELAVEKNDAKAVKQLLIEAFPEVNTFPKYWNLFNSWDDINIEIVEE